MWALDMLKLQSCDRTHAMFLTNEIPMRLIYACAFEEKSKGLREGIFGFRFMLTVSFFETLGIFYCSTYPRGLGAIFQKMY
jgi:hypothetical protein